MGTRRIDKVMKVEEHNEKGRGIDGEEHRKKKEGRMRRGRWRRRGRRWRRGGGGRKRSRRGRRRRRAGRGRWR